MTNVDSRLLRSRVLGSVLAASLLVSCILVVPAPAEHLGGTCRLTDDEREESCGECVEEHCQDELDECCRVGDSCEPAIHDIVACAIYQSCDPAGSSAAETALRTCRARSCASDCTLQGETGEVDDPDMREDAGDAATARGGVVCNDFGSGCICQVAANKPSSGRCRPPNNNEDYLCCASAKYPAAGACSCFSIGCVESSNGCLCEQQQSNQESFCGLTNSGEGTCCANGSSCHCDDSRYECPEDSEPVSSCSASDVGCEAGEKEVNDCNPD